jgi:hypothetical protein
MKKLIFSLIFISYNTFGQLSFNFDYIIPNYTTKARSIAIGDLNADGNADLAVAGASGGISVYTNTGNGGFGQQKRLIVSGSYCIAGDLNGDGNLDLAVTNSCDQTVSILINSGNADFTKSLYLTYNCPESVAIGDLNGDNYPDLAIANSGTNTIDFLRK